MINTNIYCEIDKSKRERDVRGEESQSKGTEDRKQWCWEAKVSLWKVYQTFLGKEAVILSSSAYLPSRRDG